MNVGRYVKTFTPNGRYTRHSEGDFLRLRDGRLLFAWCRFQGSASDHAHCELAGCYSEDEGETWGEAKTLISPEQYGVENVMSLSLMRMGNGDLGIFYLVKVTPNHSRIMLSRSQDEGKTFYKHIECSDPNKPFYYVVNNSRVERLRSGRLIIPVAYHRGTQSANGKWYVDGRSLATFFYSDDDGFTWNESVDMVYPPFSGTETGLQEPGLYETDAGGLRAYFRTDKLTQYESFSVDNGVHWSVAQPSGFSSPCSPLKISRCPKDQKLYAVWNPIPNYVGREQTRAGWGRTPLVCAVSEDDGMTWSDPVALADDPERGYCYPALFFTEDGCMLAAYCTGGSEERTCLAQLSIQKIPMEAFRF